MDGMKPEDNQTPAGGGSLENNAASPAPAAAPAPDAAQAPAAPAEAQPQAKTTGSMKGLLIAVLVVAVLAAAYFLFF